MIRKAVVSSLFLGLILMGAWTLKPLSLKESTNNVQQNYRANLRNFQTGIDNLIKKAQDLENTNKSVQELAQHFITVRTNYKKIEFLLAYLVDEETEKHLNGSPLKTVNITYDTLGQMPPHGLQRIEELIYAEDGVFQHKKELNEILLLLKLQADGVVKKELRREITDKMVFEAVRFGVLRIMIMGIAGFDTPKSGRGIEEAAIAWQSCKTAMEAYQVSLEQKSPEVATPFIKLWYNSTEYLQKNTDFEEFDRAYFIREFGNPIYGIVLEAQKALQIPIAAKLDIKTSKTGINYWSKNIFDKDFLVPNYYSQLSEEDSRGEVVELGKTLFFEPLLSENGQRACSSCHDPKLAFTDGKAKSISFDKKETTPRNAPTVINTIYTKRWFHDLRSFSLQHQAGQVVQSEKEFNTNFSKIIAQLNESKAYKKWFKRVFKEKITTENIGTAIAAYEQTLIGLDTPFDRYMRKEMTKIEQDVIDGFNLFMGKAKCGTCHFLPTFSGLMPPAFNSNESEVIGVPEKPELEETNKIDPDLGRFENKIQYENTPLYQHSFKTPALRNIALTAPYMHNGVFKTLDEVLIFYNSGGGAGIGWSVPNQTMPNDLLRVPTFQQDQIILFLKNLTDTVNLTSKPLSLPKTRNKKFAARRVGGEY